MQAARGTPLSPSGSDPYHPDPAHGTPSRRWLLFAGVAAVGYAVDVGTKVLAVQRLDGRSDVPVVGDLLQLTLVRNPGAAFSLGTNYTVAISVFAIVAGVVMVYLAGRLRDRIWAIGLGLALAGVLGNLTDRLLRDPGPLQGHVIDFLRLPNWPVFNVADICINLGIGLIVLQLLRGVDRDGSRPATDADAA